MMCNIRNSRDHYYNRWSNLVKCLDNIILEQANEDKEHVVVVVDPTVEIVVNKGDQMRVL